MGGETKEITKEKIKNLVKKFKETKEKGSFKGHSEEDIKIGYILELFEIFGWNTRDIEDLKSESKSIFRGRVDHAFKINGVIKFLLEDKKLSVNIQDNLEIQQKSYNYGYHKGIRYAIITNFEQMIVLDCFTKDFNKSIWKVFGCDDYYNGFGFDFLYRFRKSAFLKEKSELDLYADFDRKTIIQRNSVEELIYAQLKHWRDVITQEIQNHPIKNKFIKTDEELDEAVQTLINRLIFIRFCEDRGFESYQRLKEIISKWELKKGNSISEMLRKLFIEFDKDYDSELFTPPKYIDLELDDKILFEIISSLYTNKENNAFFDFADIGVDVLGDIYEEYLKYLLYNSKKKSRLKQKHQHRKQFGQFYTPSYIVKYILDNTLQKKLEKTNERDITNIKILDPACGSGSFLIKAIDILKEYYNQHKLENGLVILKNNIFAVDIDKKACEIAKLNLLLKTIPKKQRLDPLKENIKNGNSLISGDKEELKKYFNNGLFQKKPFNWEEQFEEIFKQGGFDIVIGNPPYVFTRGKHFDKGERDYFIDKYYKNLETTQKGKARQSGKINSFSLFILRGIQLLKDNGLLGFIVPNNLLRVTILDNLRKFILDNCKINKIVDLSSRVFKDVTASTIIIILEKEKEKSKRDNNEIEVITDVEDLMSGVYKTHKIKQGDFYKNKNYVFNIISNENYNEILKKIEGGTTLLGNIGKSFNGIATKKNKNKYIFNRPKNSKYKPLLEGKDIKRYRIEFRNRYIIYDRKLLHRPRDEKIFLSDEKIVTQRIGGGSEVIIATLDNEQYYTFNSTNNIILDNKNFSSKYILGLLNSKLINWYYVMKFTNLSVLTVNVSKTFLEQLPIKNVDVDKQKPIIEKVDKILELNKDLVKQKDKFSTKYLKLKEEIDKLDEEINDLIYDLYNVKEYKEIIENSLS